MKEMGFQSVKIFSNGSPKNNITVFFSDFKPSHDSLLEPGT